MIFQPHKRIPGWVQGVILQGTASRCPPNQSLTLSRFRKGYLERASPIRCEIYFLMNPIYINAGSLKDNYCATERNAASINGMPLIVLVV